MLFYSYPQVVLQEVPGEISLALSISGCPLTCKGCHSTEVRNPTFGSPLTVEVLQELLSKHKHISCVLFYGGEWKPQQLITLLQYCRAKGLKTCLYTGLNICPPQIIAELDFLKKGPYKESLGALASSTTNQRFYDVSSGPEWKDLTSVFQGNNNEQRTKR